MASHVADFHPRRFLSNGHLQTIAGNYLSRANGLPAPEAQLVEVSPATANQIASQVLCHCHWQPKRYAQRGRQPSSCMGSKARQSRSTSSETRTSCGARAATSSA